MSQVKRGDKVSIHYRGMLKDGTVFDESDGREPLEFTVGDGMIIPGMEEAMVGMSLGEKKTIEIASEDAYGPRDDDRVLTVPRSRLPDGLDPEVGNRLQIPQPNGQVAVVAVTEADEETITLDANHPLAGEDLVFDVELVKIG